MHRGEEDDGGRGGRPEVAGAEDAGEGQEEEEEEEQEEEEEEEEEDETGWLVHSEINTSEV